MTYIIAGFFSLILSLSNMTYAQLDTFDKQWQQVGDEIKLQGTLITENQGIIETAEITLFVNGRYTNGAITECLIEMEYEAGEIAGVNLYSYTIDRANQEYEITRENGNIKVQIMLNRQELTEIEYNLVTTLFNLETQSGSGMSTIYNQGYDQGYQDGLDVGGMNANDQYTAGYETGKLDGYNRGYDEAMKVADNPYTFRNLLFAVIESPAVFIKSWLNTEILGINVAGLLFGIFTIAVIIGLGALIKHFI